MMFSQGNSSLDMLAVKGLVALELSCLMGLGSLQLQFQPVPMECTRDNYLFWGTTLSMSSVR